MSENNTLSVGVFTHHLDAESAVKELQRHGYDMKRLSVIAKDYHTEENVVGYYNTSDRMANWGKNGLFWGWIWGLLFGSAFFFIPGIGPIAVGGPLVSWLLGAFETALVVGGFSAIGAAFAGIGTPHDSVLCYETALKANKFLLIFHGTHDEAQKAKNILLQNNAELTDTHKASIDEYEVSYS